MANRVARDLRFWLELKTAIKRRDGELYSALMDFVSAKKALLEVAKQLPYAYVPRFYQPRYEDGRIAAFDRHPEVPATIAPCVIDDLDGTPLPTRPIVRTSSVFMIASRWRSCAVAHTCVASVKAP